MRPEDRFQDAIERRGSETGDEELDAELRLVGRLRELPRALPRRSEAEARASQQLQAVLQEQRGRGGLRLVPTASSWVLRAAAGVLVLAVLAGASLLALSGGSGQQVEAATVEGVVVETSEHLLVLETAEGLQNIGLSPDTSYQDDTLAPVEQASLAPGQLVLVEGRRVRAEITATTVQQRPMALLRQWCASNPVSCYSLQPRFEALLAQCSRNVQACRVLESSLRELRAAVEQHPRPLLEAAARCRRGDAAACAEVRPVCARAPEVCRGFSQTPVRGRGAQ